MGRTLAAAALGASTLALATGAGIASAQPAPVDCAFVGATAARMQTPGVLLAGIGSQNIPAGAEIISIEVETYDDYDEVGFFSGNRDTANQTNERVAVLIGGVQVGGFTDDVPEIGAGGSNRKASITTTVHSGGKVFAGGPVQVRHIGDTTTGNSVQVRRVTIIYRTTQCDGGYPVSLTNTVTTQTVTQTPAPQQPPAQQPPVQQATGLPPVPPAQTPAAPTGNAASSPTVSNTIIEPTTGSGTATGSGTTTGNGVTPQVSAGSLIPTPASAAAPAAPAAPSQGGNLPATGSEPTNLVQLGAVAAAAGLGMIAVSGIRRRKAAATS